MRHNLLLATGFVVLVTGMIVYKVNFDKREARKAPSR
jgi:hypothetical protein